jgi:DNA polymerase-3 subunit gamma/tau
VSYLVLARKWRPQVFEEVIGQKHVVKTLQNAIVNKRIAHAFLFTGQRGVGKTSIARILAKALNCQQGPTPQPCCQCASCKEIAEGTTIDVLEIDGASNTAVDDVRELRESVKYVPSRERYKIYIIDEVHMLSNSAFNALLKTLEEPPAHVIFMFATTEPQKIPSTVLSRCQRFDLRRIPLEALVEHLMHVTAKEEIAISKNGLRWIAREAEGSMRDAQSMLDRVISYAGKSIGDSAITEVLGIVARDILLKTSQALVDKDVNGCLATVNELFYSGYDTRQFYQAFLEHLRNMIVVKSSKNPDQLLDLTRDECDVLRKQVTDSPVEKLQRLFDVWLKAEGEIYHSSMPHIVLEMLLLKMVYLKGLVPLDDALAKLNDLEKKISTKRSASPEGVECTTVQYKEVEGGSDVPAPLKEDAVPLTHKEPIGNDHNQNWDKFLTFTRNEKPMLAAVLDHGKLLRIDDKTIELGFIPNSLFMESAQDKDNAQQLKKMFEEFFGRKMRVTITPLEGEEIIDASVQSGEEENKRAGNNKNDTVRNPLVNEALSIFDGMIVEVKYGEDRSQKQ